MSVFCIIAGVVAFGLSAEEFGERSFGWGFATAFMGIVLVALGVAFMG